MHALVWTIACMQTQYPSLCAHMSGYAASVIATLYYTSCMCPACMQGCGAEVLVKFNCSNNVYIRFPEVSFKPCHSYTLFCKRPIYMHVLIMHTSCNAYECDSISFMLSIFLHTNHIAAARDWSMGEWYPMQINWYRVHSLHYRYEQARYVAAKIEMYVTLYPLGIEDHSFLETLKVPQTLPQVLLWST